MDAMQFAYWLQGYAELNDGTPPTAEQWQSIREHLSTVFNKVTPPVAAPSLTPITGPGWPTIDEWEPVRRAKQMQRPLRATC